MGKQDTAVKELFKNKPIYADFFNGSVYKGKQVIVPKDLELIESESDILITDKNNHTENFQRFRDIVMLWKNKIALAILACEIQNNTHYLMPIRNMIYDGLSYITQAKQLWNEHSKTDQKPTSDEFLSHFFKDDFLVPIITLVFYYGEKEWDGALTLYDLFSSEITDLDENLLQYIPNFHINLIDANHLENIHLFQSDLQYIFGMLQYRKDKDALQKYVQQNKSYFENLDIDTCYALAEFLNSNQLKEKAATLANGKEDVDMCQALRDLYNDGLSQGLSQGRLHGVIETAQEFGLSKEDTILKVMNKFNIEYIDALEHVNTYWVL